jgi:uncharacterized protein YdhG (YjbR/CyaY superfamily)
MSKNIFRSVDEYIGAQPPAARAVLERVRGIIRKAVPKAGEVISYGMPTYTLDGERFLNFAAWKKHYSIYAATEKVAAAFHDELAGYEVAKGTVRFPLSGPFPAKLIERIVKFRVLEHTGKAV